MPAAAQNVILGTGQLGLAIMDELAAEGVPVRLSNRRGSVNEPLPEAGAVVAADVRDPAQVAAACAGAEVVFFCAQPPYDQWPASFPPLAASVIAGVVGSGARYGGDFEEMVPAVLELLRWAGVSRHVPDGPLRELHLSGPVHADEPVAEAPVVELQVPIAPVEKGS